MHVAIAVTAAGPRGAGDTKSAPLPAMSCCSLVAHNPGYVKSTIGWVMESNRVRTDKASGIRNDPNDWAIEHGDPHYILDLVGRVVSVSMQTLEIVDALPHLEL